VLIKLLVKDLWFSYDSPVVIKEDHDVVLEGKSELILNRLVL